MIILAVTVRFAGSFRHGIAVPPSSRRKAAKRVQACCLRIVYFRPCHPRVQSPFLLSLSKASSLSDPSLTLEDDRKGALPKQSISGRRSEGSRTKDVTIVF